MRFALRIIELVRTEFTESLPTRNGVTTICSFPICPLVCVFWMHPMLLLLTCNDTTLTKVLFHANYNFYSPQLIFNFLTFFIAFFYDLTKIHFRRCLCLNFSLIRAKNFEVTSIGHSPVQRCHHSFHSKLFIQKELFEYPHHH